MAVLIASNLRKEFAGDPLFQGVSFSVDRKYAPNLRSVARIQVNFCTVGALDYVAISHDAIYVDEKTAAARQLFAAGIERLNRHGRRFDPANQFGKSILRKG